MFYWVYTRKQRQANALYDDDEYIIVDDPELNENEAKIFTNTPTVQSSNNAILKLLRLNDDGMLQLCVNTNQIQYAFDR